ncbi:conserved protein of unknown function [Pararobbsia alpina]|uniref:hypothetical protein n=1 Tax=Pararobbsia alpina TaxID=621374 RepID=UPI0039A45972
MADLKSISSAGVAKHWPTRKAIVNRLTKSVSNRTPLAKVEAYNNRIDSGNTVNLPPNSTYVPVSAELWHQAEILALTGRPWEQEMTLALGVRAFCDQLFFFWHQNFRVLYPDHPQPLRMLSWESMMEATAWEFILGRIQEGIYHGYLAFAALNRGYQLQISYSDKHRRVHVFVLRLFSLWRGDVTHDWPAYGYDEPIYEGILERWDRPDLDDLTPWLLAACDRHTHESRMDSETKFYDCSEFARTPLEILFLFRLRELKGLANPTLNHPLMDAPFEKLLEVQPAYVPDELVLGTLRRVREDWPQYDEVVALEALKSQPTSTKMK